MSTAELELEQELELDTETPPAKPVPIADRYRLAVVHAATSGNLEIDESLLRGTGRFELDFTADVDKLRKRFQAAKNIEQADAELARLAENPPRPPRPTADMPVSDYKTLGALSQALYAVQNQGSVTWAPEESRRLAVADAKASRARAIGELRFSADPNLQSEAGQLSNAIARHREAVAKHSQLLADVASLEKLVESGYRTEEERDTWHEKRRELAKLRVRVADPPASLDEAEVRRKIEALAAKQLDPMSVAFAPPEPAGPGAGVGSW